ncbi:MAG: hypothetical protein V4644_01420 [Patescibacteria group bacterium]
MNRTPLLLFALAFVAIASGAAWYLVDSRNDAFGVPAPMATSTPQVDESLAIYTNGPYGFSVFYPEAAAVEYAFDETYHLPSFWRANALPEGAGMPIVAFIPYAISREDSYPRYFTAMVRIGASSDPSEIERCESSASDQGETQLPDATINGAVWKAFSFQSAGMMQYASGVSYRRIHEEKCIALEKIRTGSSYREEPASDDIADSVLDAEYEKLSEIVESVTFAR